MKSDFTESAFMILIKGAFQQVMRLDFGAVFLVLKTVNKRQTNKLLPYFTSKIFFGCEPSAKYYFAR